MSEEETKEVERLMRERRRTCPFTLRWCSPRCQAYMANGGCAILHDLAIIADCLKTMAETIEKEKEVKAR